MIRSTRRTTTTAVGTAAALALSAFAAAPASAALPSGLQDIRAYACVPGATEDAGFTDVGQQLPEFVLGINCLAGFGITQGTSDTTYSPAATVTRRQMAQFIQRQGQLAGLALDDTSDAGFTDLAGEPPAAVNAINALANAGIVQGTSTGPLRFSPGGEVRRDQMAAFINRLQNAVADQADDVSAFPTGTSPFRDTNNPNVSALAGAGIVQGTGDGSFSPAGSLTRAQMSAFLMRHVNALFQEGDFGDAEPDVSANEAFSVAGTAVSTADAGFLASGLEPSTDYRITLVTEDAFTVENGVVRFAEFADRTNANPGSDSTTAVPGSTTATIASVNGAAPDEGTGERTVIATTDQTGSLLIQVQGGASASTVTPFVYLVPESTTGYPNRDTLLEVNPDDDLNYPVELFGYAANGATVGG